MDRWKLPQPQACAHASAQHTAKEQGVTNGSCQPRKLTWKVTFVFVQAIVQVPCVRSRAQRRTRVLWWFSSAEVVRAQNGENGR
jgi:hypothetical protein